MEHSRKKINCLLNATEVLSFYLLILTNTYEVRIRIRCNSKTIEALFPSHYRVEILTPSKAVLAINYYALNRVTIVRIIF